MDDLIIEVSAAQAEALGIPSLHLGSMAGHDAAHMASLTRAGMLFVPSLGGKSHCPEEESRIADIKKAGNVLLQTILELDRQLSR
jgi:N-carbamoyl-L-amino-acid hydrolase